MTWHRRNRWWLLVLPLALVASVGANGYYVRDFWWEAGYHDQTHVSEPGDFVRVRQPFEDALGTTTRTFRARLAGLDTVATFDERNGDQGREVPEGMVAYRVLLEIEAAPDQDLNYCNVALVDEDGNVYGDDTFDPVDQQLNKCVPADRPGPEPVLDKTGRRGVRAAGTEPRPGSWSVAPVVLARQGVRITAARLTWLPNDYVTLRLKRGVD